jgi:hypothetical protein
MTASVGFTLALASAVAAVAIAPAAAGALRAEITSVACSATTACVIGKNAGTGPGVSGTSAKGVGVIGASTTSYGMLATSKTGVGLESIAASNKAIYATNSSTSSTIYAAQSGAGAALAGLTNVGTGVSGTSKSGTGVRASSTDGPGVVATSQNSEAIYAYSPDGTAVVANSGYGSGSPAGSGSGVYGYSNSGDGIDAVSDSGIGISAVNEVSGYGVFADTASGLGIYSKSENGNGLDASGAYIGVIGRASSGGYPFVATDSFGNDLFWVDSAGNLVYTGSIGTLAHTTRGDVRTYGASATTPTVEDFGSSTLRNGSAHVALDPAFARSIEGTESYRVFVTPAGDTDGLFVAERDPAGFVVREAHGGRDSLDFDYRIVATIAGHTRERMSFVATADVVRAPVPAVRPRLRAPREPRGANGPAR